MIFDPTNGLYLDDFMCKLLTLFNDSGEYETDEMYYIHLLDIDGEFIGDMIPFKLSFEEEGNYALLVLDLYNKISEYIADIDI